MAIRLMLADDHRAVREGLKCAMSRRGLDVVAEAADGEAAVAVARTARPDVILMDVAMPVMDGVEATRRIRAEDPSIVVVMLTMHADPTIASDALQAGAAGYLVKDCSVDDLVHALRRVVGGAALPLPRFPTLRPPGRAGLDGQRDERDGRERDGPNGTTAEGRRLITPREAAVLQLIADGCSTPEVAAQLFISQKTVKNHLASIYQKLEARDRTQALLRAIRLGLVDLS